MMCREVSMIGEVSDIIQSICACVNIVVILIFAWIETGRRKEDNKNIEKKAIYERKQLWYEKLVIDKTVNAVANYYKVILGCTDNLPDGNIRSFVCELKNSMFMCKHSVSPFLSIFSSNLAQNVVRTMTKSYDSIIREMERNKKDRNILELKKGIENDCSVIMKRI